MHGFINLYIIKYFIGNDVDFSCLDVDILYKSNFINRHYCFGETDVTYLYIFMVQKDNAALDNLTH